MTYRQRCDRKITFSCTYANNPSWLSMSYGWHPCVTTFKINKIRDFSARLRKFVTFPSSKFSKTVFWWIADCLRGDNRTGKSNNAANFIAVPMNPKKKFLMLPQSDKKIHKERAILFEHGGMYANTSKEDRTYSQHIPAKNPVTRSISLRTTPLNRPRACSCVAWWRALQRSHPCATPHPFHLSHHQYRRSLRFWRHSRLEILTW